ncbi:MAG: phenylacetic acid degradation bifunctional protein PaaZ [Balneolaceae bacterium]|nr:MAG: phenylacetic acid degradation bifunctional protein PaaZ [Balneolaceae bacterium]
MEVQSYLKGEWVSEGDKSNLCSVINNKPVASLIAAEPDYHSVCEYARNVGGPALRQMSIHERAFRIKFMAQFLLEKKESYYSLSSHTGATRRDSWIDIEGGLITALGLSSQARKNLSDLPWHVEGGAVTLSRKGTFSGQHICVPRHGLALQINAFNFPVWGMLEKLAPAFIAGVPSLIKPSPTSCFLAFAVFRDMVESGYLPEGSVQFLAVDIPGDLLNHLGSQDTILFTGSAATGKKLKSHPSVIEHNVRFNLEADSLNASLLGPDVTPEMDEFDIFIREVVSEMTVKTGQKCTAIRRVIVPAEQLDKTIDALKRKLGDITPGNPADPATKMGPLASDDQSARFSEQAARLMEVTESIWGNPEADGLYTGARVLLCHKPMEVDEVHQLEAFGPLTTLMPYQTLDEAIAIANRGGGSLVGSLFTADDEIAARVAMGCAHSHGRFMIINRSCAGESTGHGSPIASLVHGGPGRAGGGEELGGARSVLHHMQRVALQGSPTTLSAITGQYVKGSTTRESENHLFKKYFEELNPGDSITTHRRTVTEADIVNFGGLTGDHFYAHFDEIAAKNSLFGKRVAHGYFVLSAAAGLFVHPSPGPVLLNYGLDDLRFIAPVYPGDTIQARLIVKRKSFRQKRESDKEPYGMVWFDVEVTNQQKTTVAEYTITTLIKRRTGSPFDQ